MTTTTSTWHRLLHSKQKQNKKIYFFFLNKTQTEHRLHFVATPTFIDLNVYEYNLFIYLKGRKQNEKNEGKKRVNFV